MVLSARKERHVVCTSLGYQKIGIVVSWYLCTNQYIPSNPCVIEEDPIRQRYAKLRVLLLYSLKIQ